MIHVAVIRGGRDTHDTFKDSLATGGDMIDGLSGHDQKYVVHDIFIDKQGTWHRRGIPSFPNESLRGIDVVLLGVHGPYAESGEIQKHLERERVPFTGTRNDASMRARNKAEAKTHLSALRSVNDTFKVAPSVVVLNTPDVHFAQIAKDIFQRFGPPYVVKPVHGSSSTHVSIAETVFDLPAVLEHVMGHSGDDCMVEQYIPGKHISTYVFDDFRNEDTYALPPIEMQIQKHQRIVTPEQKRNEYDAADLLIAKTDVKRQVEDAARAIHDKLDLSHYSKIDFILAPHGVYFLEANTHPNLGASSALPKPLEYVGATLRQVYDHLVNIARS